MTKQDILNMKERGDVMKALATNPDLWDKELDDHLKAVSRQALLDKFGTDDVLYTPPKKQA